MIDTQRHYRLLLSYHRILSFVFLVSETQHDDPIVIDPSRQRNIMRRIFAVARLQTHDHGIVMAPHPGFMR